MKKQKKEKQKQVRQEDLDFSDVDLLSVDSKNTQSRNLGVSVGDRDIVAAGDIAALLAKAGDMSFRRYVRAVKDVVAAIAHLLLNGKSVFLKGIGTISVRNVELKKNTFVKSDRRVARITVKACKGFRAALNDDVVMNKLKSSDVRAKNIPLTEEEEEEVVAQYRSDGSYRKLARLYNVPISWISSVLQKHGVVVRKNKSEVD
jgi:nucleoid DNA-binding protein